MPEEKALQVYRYAFPPSVRACPNTGTPSGHAFFLCTVACCGAGFAVSAHSDAFVQRVYRWDASESAYPHYVSCPLPHRLVGQS